VAVYEVRNLRKVYRSPRVVANDGITFTMSPGEAFGLLGPNGAGKTTLVRQLVGLLTPTSGEIRLLGEALGSGRKVEGRVGRLVGYLPQGPLGLDELKVSEALRWMAMLRGLGDKAATEDANELLDALELESVVDRQVRKLSGGQRRLVQIGMTLVGRLPVLILDEPTADVDPSLRRRIWELLSDRVGTGAAVLLVTHDVAEAEHVLDHVAILDRGRVAASGTPAQLKANLAHRTRIEVVIGEGSPVRQSEIATLLGPTAKADGRRVSGWVAADEALRTLEKILASVGEDQFEDVRLVTPTLEDVYLERSGRLMEDEAPDE
jgi:ABC-2 type transport system ATP-binding protein